MPIVHIQVVSDTHVCCLLTKLRCSLHVFWDHSTDL